MIFIKRIHITAIALLLTILAFGQSDKPKEYLQVQEPIHFDKASFTLAWTSHPTENYYKQEYLVAGDSLEKFKRLVLIEALSVKETVKDVVAAKIAELKKLKEKNPVVNFETFERDGEVMLDFLLSQNTPDGKYVSVVERNVYRYKEVTDKNGQKAIQLFGVSERAYGDDIDNFFSNLKAHRFDLINAVGTYDIPTISIPK